MATRNSLNVSLGVINDVPKIDLRKRFNQQINNNKENNNKFTEI